MPGDQLGVLDHDRDSAGMKYVYPVVSRRAQGVSVGINLNVNNACNWQCVYCQVPGLVIGSAPPVDMELLETELRSFLDELLFGSFMRDRVPEGMRRVNDIALSGNGEPTSAKEFAAVVELVARVRREFSLEAVKIVLITNGSLMYRDEVRKGLAILALNQGEVWFKLDRATEKGLRQINHTEMSMARVEANLEISARLCPTWLQTCWFEYEGITLQEEEESYLELLKGLRTRAIPLQGVHLYSVAREPMTAEKGNVRELSSEVMNEFSEGLVNLGFKVRLNGKEVDSRESSVGSVG